MSIPENYISKLDASMIRCGVVFMFSYRFKGIINQTHIAHSVDEVLSSIARFKRVMETDKKYRAAWLSEIPALPLFSVFDCDDIDSEFIDFYGNISSKNQETELPPMFFVMMKDRRSDEFILLQCGKHSYCDGGSATVIFNHVIEHYNALFAGDDALAQSVLETTKKYTSPSPNSLFSLGLHNKQKIINVGNLEHIKNIHWFNVV